MDDIVKAAMAKWPNVPHCFGWLGLDARGQWYMRDDRAQAAGPFSPPLGEPPAPAAAKGSVLRHDKLIEFIGRNYDRDANGHWYFQNGPQRVYVELELTPWVWRLQPDGSIRAHTGVDAGAVQACWMDEAGRLYLDTDLGTGIVHTADMSVAADAVEAGRWVPEDIAISVLVQRGGWIRSPQQAQTSPAST